MVNLESWQDGQDGPCLERPILRDDRERNRHQHRTNDIATRDALFLLHLVLDSEHILLWRPGCQSEGDDQSALSE